jgi:Ca2+-transporting ATPase
MAFVVILLGMLFYFYQSDEGMTVRHLTIFFTTFVALQMWNLLNVSVFSTGSRSFFFRYESLGLNVVLLAIVVGQVLIVQFGGEVFRTVPLSTTEWVGILACSSVVLWVGELIRGVKRLFKKR